jgi:hypothetical protein
MSDDDTVILRNYSGADEVNARGISYKVRWGVVTVPAEDVEPLLHVGGFHVARPDDPGAQHSTIDDVREAAWSLPPSKARSTLLAILESPTSLAHLTQSISFT